MSKSGSPEHRAKLSEIAKAKGFGKWMTGRAAYPGFIEHAKARKGKTYEELYGDRAEEEKRRRRESNKLRFVTLKRSVTEGQRASARKRKGKTYEEIYGDRAEEQAAIRSESHKRRYVGKVRKDDIRPKHNGCARYAEWRTSVFQRDSYTCQHCRIIGCQDLQAHHIRAWAQYPLLRYEVSNGITFCASCHKKEHRRLKNMSNVFKDLLAAAETTAFPPRRPDEDAVGYQTRMIRAIGLVSDETWNRIPIDPSQSWYNDAVATINRGEPLPEMPGFEDIPATPVVVDPDKAPAETGKKKRGPKLASSKPKKEKKEKAAKPEKARGVSTHMRELVIQNPTWTVAQIQAELIKMGWPEQQVNPSTVATIRTDTTATLNIIKKLGYFNGPAVVAETVTEEKPEEQVGAEAEAVKS